MNFSNATDLRRLVIKVGSSLLIDERGELDRAWLDGLAEDIAELHGHGRDLLVVSSGAIAIGSEVMGINKRRARLSELQAAAAAGQVQLAHAWSDALAKHDIHTAQILLTPEDTENRRRFLNARGTLGQLLDHRVVPIINENDTVTTEEIRYGDNDRLAARVAQLVMADGLLLLSDVDGLYRTDPNKDASAEHIPEVRAIDDEIVAMAGETRTDVGTGGMATKVQAAGIATHAGCSTFIASGQVERPIHALVNGARCTVFRAEKTPAAVRKQWLVGVMKTRGRLMIDPGAAQALKNGKSLLPVGIVAANGSFQRGDVVAICDDSGKEVGRGLVEYDQPDAAKVTGCRSENIESELGYRGPTVMVHRDNLVIFDADGTSRR